MSAPRATRRPRVVLHGARLLLGLVAASCLIGVAPVPVSGQEASAPSPGFGGIQGRAAASGVHAFYNVGGLLPIASPVDFGAPDALATISSGPTTFARASAADPGDLLANPDALLALFSADYPAGTIPPYPYRVAATSGVGEPTAESNPAPGLRARVEVDETGSSAVATMPALEGGAVATVGSMSARATTKVDDATVTTRSRTVLSEFDLLGMLRIGSLVTDLTAVADGTTTKLTGGTTVTGATFFGTPVIIDANGIRTDPDAEGSPLLGGADLNEALAAAGIRVTLEGPVGQGGGTSGALATGGLRIDLEFSERSLPILAALANVPKTGNPIPGAPGLDDLIVALRARNLVALELGRGIVSLSTRPGFRAPDVAVDDVTGGLVPDATGSLGGDDLGALPTPPVVAPPGGDGARPAPVVPTLTGETPATSLAGGIGALVLLVLLAQPFVGAAIARFTGAVLGADAADICLREER